MTALYIIYGLLIAAAIVFVPLRIRNRRRILREIDSLRLKYNEDISQLIKIIESETDTMSQDVEQSKPDIIWQSGLPDKFSDEIKRAHDELVFYACKISKSWEETKEESWQLLWEYKGAVDVWASTTEDNPTIHDTEANIIRILKGRSESSSSPFRPSHKGAWAEFESALKKSIYASDMQRNRLLEKVT